jgi:outer membrane protein assembly factor BamD
VLRDFDGTPATEEALIIMVKAYDALKMTDMRDDASRVLTSNYPNSTRELKDRSKSILQLLGVKSDRKKAQVEVPAPQ